MRCKDRKKNSLAKASNLKKSGFLAVFKFEILDYLTEN